MGRAVKTALIAYHRNAETLYPNAWLVQYRDSILAQTEPVDVFELDYGGGRTRLFGESRWWSCPLPNHVAAQNVLLDAVFDLGYEAVLNSNVDDYYPPHYAAVSVRQLGDGVQLSSGNFVLVNEDGTPRFTHHDLHERDLASALLVQDNIVCHPAVAYRKDFWSGCSRYDPAELPLEDLRLWQREVGRFRFGIAAECLVYHRVHPRAVSAEAR